VNTAPGRAGLPVLAALYESAHTVAAELVCDAGEWVMKPRWDWRGMVRPAVALAALGLAGFLAGHRAGN